MTSARSAIAGTLPLIFASAMMHGQTEISKEQIVEILRPIRGAYHLPALAAAIVTSEGVIGAGTVGVRKKGSEVPATDPG